MDVRVPWHLEDDDLQMEGFEEVATGFMVTVRSCRRGGVCPKCEEVSEHVHSRYVRRVSDLPWSGQRVSVALRVRRFYCRNGECPQHIFNERLPGVIGPYARRTDRLQDCLAALGQGMGGEGGARLANRLGMPVSPDTLLRQLKGSARPPVSPPAFSASMILPSGAGSVTGRYR